MSIKKFEEFGAVNEDEIYNTRLDKTWEWSLEREIQLHCNVVIPAHDDLAKLGIDTSNMDEKIKREIKDLRSDVEGLDIVSELSRHRRTNTRTSRDGVFHRSTYLLQFTQDRSDVEGTEEFEKLMGTLTGRMHDFQARDPFALHVGIDFPNMT